MNRAYAGAGQHGKSSVSHHGHVDQHAVALLHAQCLQAGGHALHFPVQLGKAVTFFAAGFGRDGDQRGLFGAVLEVAIDRVVAQIAQATFKPMYEWRLVVVADPIERLEPVNQLGLFCPEGIGLLNGLTVKIGVTHGGLRIVHLGSPGKFYGFALKAGS